MNIPQLEAAAKDFLRIVEDYPHYEDKLGERFLDMTFYAFLEGRFGKMSRQHHVRVPSKTHPLRVDFRHGTNNPVYIEFAARPPKGGVQVLGGSNWDELRKLTRIPHGRKILILLDAYSKHYIKDKLKPGYDVITSAKGNYTRYPVTILYVHKSNSFRIEWSR